MIMLAPSISALNSMISIAETYFTEHGLSFSTDPNPRKLKTKCISWLKDKRNLPYIVLCGNKLPLVDKVTHLGISITNDKYIADNYMKVKKGYIHLYKHSSESRI